MPHLDLYLIPLLVIVGCCVMWPVNENSAGRKLMLLIVMGLAVMVLAGEK
jgi:hypothetical protein